MLPNTGPHLHAFALDLNLHAFVIRMTRWREGRATLNSAEDDHRAMLPGICSAPQWRRCSKIEREITMLYKHCRSRSSLSYSFDIRGDERVNFILITVSGLPELESFCPTTLTNHVDWSCKPAAVNAGNCSAAAATSLLHASCKPDILSSPRDCC